MFFLLLRGNLTLFRSTTCFGSSYEPSSGWSLFLCKAHHTISNANCMVCLKLWLTIFYLYVLWFYTTQRWCLTWKQLAWLYHLTALTYIINHHPDRQYRFCVPLFKFYKCKTLTKQFPQRWHVFNIWTKSVIIKGTRWRMLVKPEGRRFDSRKCQWNFSLT
jgi:hypothetical protein